eukprot:3539925-Alexandrium_andersonii.AAC.1
MRRRRTCARLRASVGVAAGRLGARSQVSPGEVRVGASAGGPLLARRGVAGRGGALPEAHN